MRITPTHILKTSSAPAKDVEFVSANAGYRLVVRALLLIGMLQPLAAKAQNKPIPGISATQGDITSVAGSNKSGSTGAPTIPTQAKFLHPSGVAFDSTGNLYIGEATNSTSTFASIYELNIANNQVSLIAGSTSAITRQAPTGVAAIGSWIGSAQSLAFDSKGNLFIAATYDNVIDEIPANSTTLNVYAGTWGKSGFANGALSQATFNAPTSIFIDKTDNIYVADAGNYAIRKISADGTSVTTIAGGTQCTTEVGCKDGGLATSASFFSPSGVAVDSAGNVFAVDATYTARRSA